ncbi:MAG: CBS domain-containing protein [Nitrososphaeraceae archaeon]|nr:CBS domain-containing protein [Nitrososphaeraceae archaeon]
MTPVPLETADSSDNIYNICQKMTKKNVGCIIIIENKVPVGIITERDIVRKVIYENKDVKNTKTSEIMSHPLITVSPDSYPKYPTSPPMINGATNKIIIKIDGPLLPYFSFENA